MMINEKLGVYVAVVSSNRSGNVPKMHEVIGGQASWFVPQGQQREYIDAGAKVVYHSNGDVCASRNKALLVAWGEGAPCLQLSDDLRKIEKPIYSEEKGRWVAVKTTFDEAVMSMMFALAETGAKLAGVAPTSNPFYFSPKRRLTTRSFIVGDMILVDSCDVFFDERLRFKEDYDYTMAHIEKYGVVARCNDVLATFLHRTNKGGACAVRTAEGEQNCINLLIQKWGDVIKLNPKRPKEIILRP